MWHTIVIHAVAGGIALLAGCIAIRRGALFGTYLWSLAVMEAFLVLAIAAAWPVIDVTARVLFAAFALLGLFMVWRADQARRIRPSGSAGPTASYVEHVESTLVGLLDAFIVIVVLDVGARVWLVATAGALIAVAGHFVLRARLVRPARWGPDRTRSVCAPKVTCRVTFGAQTAILVAEVRTAGLLMMSPRAHGACHDQRQHPENHGMRLP